MLAIGSHSAFGRCKAVMKVSRMPSVKGPERVVGLGTQRVWWSVGDIHLETGVSRSLRDFLALPMAPSRPGEVVGTRGRAGESLLPLESDLTFSLSDISVSQTGGSVEMGPCWQ